MVKKKVVKRPAKVTHTHELKHPDKPKRLIRTRTFLLRIIATFIASGLSIVGIGSVFGLDLLKSVLFAGAVGVATVTEGLARAYLIDGKLTITEMNRAFRNYDSRLQEEEEGGFGCNCHCTNCCPNNDAY